MDLQSASLKTKLFCETSWVFELDNIKNAAILRDVLNFWLDWQRPKRSKSARLPHFLSWQHQKRSNSARFFSKMGSGVAELTASYQCVLRFFQSICLKYCACHEKVRPGHTKCSAAPATQNHLSKPEDLMLQNATPLRKSAPWPPNISDEHVSCTARATRNASCQILCLCPTPAIVFEAATKPPRFAHFWPLRLPRKTRSIRPKVFHPSVFSHYWLRLRNVLRATTACTFFDISTSRSGFAPQRCALFRHLNFQKWSEHEVFLYMLSWTRASCHSGVQFFISHPARWLRTRRFSEPTFRLRSHKSVEKHSESRLSYLSRTCIFFLLTLFLLWSSLFSSLLLSSLLFSDSSPPLHFHLSILSEVWLLNFLRRYQSVLRMSHEDMLNQLHQI